MDFMVMVLLADVSALGFMVFAITTSILILDKLGVFDD